MRSLLLLAAQQLVAAPSSSGGAPREVLRAQYAFAWGRAINCTSLKEELTATSTSSHSFLLEDNDGSSYLSAVECLAQTTGLVVGGVPFTAWFTLIPPAEGALGSCSTPADSPVTAMNETALFNQSLGPKGCYDYLAWATVVGRLSKQFPHMRYLNVDDFSDADNEKYFSPDSSRQMVAALRPNARLVPTLYYNSRSSIVDRNLSVDGVLFYFRNEKEGLSGSCAEPTTANLPAEVTNVRRAIPSGASLHIGLYISGAVIPSGRRAWDCSTPSARYLLQGIICGSVQSPFFGLHGTCIYHGNLDW
jgi:hypothetical protein